MTRAGMALLRMGSPEEARILDDVDLTLTLDSRTLSSHQMTSIDLTFKPIVLRASYRDIMLILTIVNKAIDAYGKQTSVVSNSKPSRPSLATSTTGASRPSGGPTQGIVSNWGQASEPLLGTAHVVLSKEQVRREDSQPDDLMNSSLAQGFVRWVPLDSNWRPARTALATRCCQVICSRSQRLVWRGRLYTRHFLYDSDSWKLRAATTLETSFNYWNLTNSHWEPCMYF
jgi:vacuolar protein sorting-associated protein 13A/C